MKLFNKIINNDTKEKDSRNFGWDLFQIVVSVLLAIVALLLANVWAQNLKDKSEQVAAVVAARDLTAPASIKEGDFKVIQIRKELLPTTYVSGNKLEALKGVTLIHPLSAAQIVTTNELAAPLDINLGGMKVPDKSFGFLLPESWLASPLPELAKGDTVNIIFSKVSNTTDVTNTLAIGVPVLVVNRDKEGVSSILLSLDRELSESLTKLKASGASIVVTVQGIAPESVLFPERKK